jgi:predicted nucleic-acid-binding protein
VRITVDANLLLRLVLQDDLEQADLAATELNKAEVAIIPIVALCEFVWVLRRRYGFERAEIAAKLIDLSVIATVQCDRPALQAGLDLMAIGGDFADGVIAHLGEREGAQTFVTFDRDAVRRLKALNRSVRLVGSST